MKNDINKWLKITIPDGMIDTYECNEEHPNILEEFEGSLILTGSGAELLKTLQLDYSSLNPYEIIEALIRTGLKGDYETELENENRKHRTKEDEAEAIEALKASLAFLGPSKGMEILEEAEWF